MNTEAELEIQALRDELRSAQARAAEQYVKFVEEIKWLGEELRKKEAQLEQLQSK